MRLRERIYAHKFRYSYAKEYILPWTDQIPTTKKLTLKCKESKKMGDWAMWEIRLIHRLKPRFNKTHMKLARAA